MRVLVAGSTGLVGQAVFNLFTAKGFEVIGISTKDLDLKDTLKTKNFILDLRPTIVICAAAKVGGIGANNSYPVQFLSENLIIQNSILEASHNANVDKLVFLGSSCIYPRDCEQPIKEEFLMTGPLEKTNSAYAIAKIAGIELVNSYRKQYGRKWISLMPTNIYGPGDNFDLATSHVFPALIRRFVDAADNNSRVVTLWGSGNVLREFLHVEDLARAILFAAKEYDSEQHLNVGSGVDISIRELALKISSAVGFTGEIKWDSSKLDGTPRKVLDISRIRSLGWKPEIGIDDGILQTINWYREAKFRGRLRK